MTRKEYQMKRLSMIGLAAAAAIVLSVGTSAPAQAKIFFSFGHGFGYGYGIHHGYGWHNCGWRTVKVRRHHRWIFVQRRVCW